MLQEVLWRFCSSLTPPPPHTFFFLYFAGFWKGAGFLNRISWTVTTKQSCFISAANDLARSNVIQLAKRERRFCQGNTHAWTHPHRDTCNWQELGPDSRRDLRTHVGKQNVDIRFVLSHFEGPRCFFLFFFSLLPTHADAHSQHSWKEFVPTRSSLAGAVGSFSSRSPKKKLAPEDANVRKRGYGFLTWINPSVNHCWMESHHLPERNEKDHHTAAAHPPSCVDRRQPAEGSAAFTEAAVCCRLNTWWENKALCSRRLWEVFLFHSSICSSLENEMDVQEHPVTMLKVRAAVLKGQLHNVFTLSHIKVC